MSDFEIILKVGLEWFGTATGFYLIGVLVTAFLVLIYFKLIHKQVETLGVFGLFNSDFMKIDIIKCCAGSYLSGVYILCYFVYFGIGLLKDKVKISGVKNLKLKLFWRLFVPEIANDLQIKNIEKLKKMVDSYIDLYPSLQYVDAVPYTRNKDVLILIDKKPYKLLDVMNDLYDFDNFAQKVNQMILLKKLNKITKNKKES